MPRNDPANPAGDELNALLDYLKRARGFDFSGYKKTSLSRRIEKRMEQVKAASFAEYQDYLEVNPREFTELFNTVLINVTSFMRDAPAWDYLAESVVPKLLAAVPAPEPIRVWSAGCASGEEAYTAAIVLAEALGIEEFKDRVKIYATDLDDEALAAARQAIYSNDALKTVPEPLIEKYFEQSSRGTAFRPDLRRAVIFGRNDLVADAPISRVDLLICRNVLMYFTPETQARVLERFNFALKPTGYLFLGKSEMLVSHPDLFAPHDLKWRIFRKVPRDGMRDRLSFLIPPGQFEDDGGEAVRARAAALSPVAQIAVDRAGFLADANLRARELFGLTASDVGRPFQDIPLSYRPADLRSALDSVYADGEPVRVGRAPLERAGEETRIIEIDVVPVAGDAGSVVGATITFADVTLVARLHDEHERSKVELEAAYEELQSTVEELETTNEELQSTNEELETTNEELQSTNEELETMNEELQSTNDELETMNTEVNTRAGELDRVNLFLEGILGSLGVGVVVLDSERRIQVWNDMAVELWGLRAEEVEGRPLTSLDIGLPVQSLEDPLARAFAGDVARIEERIEAVNRRGRAFECLVRIMPLTTRAGETYGVLVLMGETPAEELADM